MRHRPRGKPWTDEQFWDMAIRVGPCLEWQGILHPGGGYGQLKVDGLQRRAHRYAWTLRYGPIPNEMFVLHTCDNPPCIEPLHLFLGTHQDNMRDRMAKGRNPLSGKLGEMNPNAKLTPVQVDEIRDLHSQGLGPRQIARRYSVSHQQISKILRGLKWGRPAA